MTIAAGLTLPFVWIQNRAPFPGETGCVFVQHEESRWECYASIYKKKLLADDRESYLARIDKKGRTNVKFENDCHEGMHRAVNSLVLDDGINPLDLLVQVPGTTNCTRGLQHGLLEATVDDDPKMFAKVFDRLCKNGADEAEQFNCYHGLGHAYMFNEDHDVRRAADRCWLLPEERAVDGCLDGVFMQGSTNIRHPDPRKGFEQSCTDARPHELLRCFQQAVNAFTPEAGIKTSAQSREICAGMADPMAITMCLTGTTFDAGLETLAWCDRMMPDGGTAARCAMQVAISAIRGDSETADVADACRDIGSEPVLWGCGAAMGQTTSSPVPEPWHLDTDDRSIPSLLGLARSHCSAFDVEFRGACEAASLGCWPNESSYTRMSGNRLHRVCTEPSRVPDEVLLKMKGETIPSQYHPDFDRWYADLAARHAKLPRGT